MRKHFVLCVLAVTLASRAFCGDDVPEDLVVFELEEHVSGREKAKAMECRTENELPWKHKTVMSQDASSIPESFSGTREKIKHTWNGKGWPAVKTVWTWNVMKTANLPVRRIEFITIAELGTSAFEVPPMRADDLYIPANCVSFKTERLKPIPNRPDYAAGSFYLQESFDFQGDLKPGNEILVSGKKTKTYEFHFEFNGPKRREKGVALLATDLPGGVAGMKYEVLKGRRKGKVGYFVKSIKLAPRPKGLVKFPEEHLAYAAPSGYKRKTVEGALGAWEDGKGRAIEIQRLKTPFKADDMLTLHNDRIMNDENFFMHMAPPFHLGGQCTVVFADEKRDVEWYYTVRNKTLYRLTMHKMVSAAMLKKLAVLRNWRWLVSPDTNKKAKDLPLQVDLSGWSAD